MGLDDITFLRKGTDEIINVNPCEIEIKRHVESEDEYGSLISEDITLEKQTVRIAELSHSETQRLVIEGVLKNHLVNVTAKFDADIQAGDRFEFCDKTYKILFMRKFWLGGFSKDCIYKQSGRAEELNEEV